MTNRPLAVTLIILAAWVCDLPLVTSSPTSTPPPAVAEGTPSPLPATAPLASSTPPPARAASITGLLNAVQSRGTAAEDWAAATLGQMLPGGGEVQTLEDGEARVDISPDTIVRLAPSTHFVVADLRGSDERPDTQLELIVGELWVILNSALNGGSFDVETPVGVATVRGSYLSVDYDLVSDSLIISCLEGLCSVRNPLGVADLIAEQETLIRRGLPPEPPARWIPIDSNVGSGSCAKRSPSSLRRSPAWRRPGARQAMRPRVRRGKRTRRARAARRLPLARPPSFCPLCRRVSRPGRPFSRAHDSTC